MSSEAGEKKYVLEGMLWRLNGLADLIHPVLLGRIDFSRARARELQNRIAPNFSCSGPQGKLADEAKSRDRKGRGLVT